MAPRTVAVPTMAARTMACTYHCYTHHGPSYFNQTQRARAVLTAWAEAMAWPENTKAPDDQVFDTLLKKGGWLARASFGWLPSSYLRTMPAYYRGVDPVIEHDHGAALGLGLGSALGSG